MRSSIAGRKDAQRYAEIAAEFVRLKVDVIVTVGSAVPTVKQATSVIPFVFALATDPVGKRPRRKLGASGRQRHWTVDPGDRTAGKRLELLREVVPQLQRLAILFDFGNPQPVLEMGETQAAARTLGLEVVQLVIQRAEDIAAFATLKADALYVAEDHLVVANRPLILTLALGARLPTIFSSRDFVKAGALISYGPNASDMFRHSADYVDKILRGTKPGDIPVEQPTKFDLVINLKTAKVLGLTIPPTLLAVADEVIE